MIILSKLVQYSNAVNNAIIITFFDYLCNGFCIEGITSKTLNIIGFTKVKAINFVTLLLEI